MKIKNCKKFVCFLVASTMSIGLLSGCSFGESSSTKTIQILETSDVHGHFDGYDYLANKEDNGGSLSQASVKIDELREENPNTLVVDAGDSLQGNMANYFIDDDIHPMFAAMNEIGYDVWCVGNHEFNYSPEYLEKFIKEPEATVLCGNVYRPDGSSLAQDYIIKEVDGVRIGIIGMTTPNIMRWDGDKFNGWTITDPIEETQKAIDEMENQDLADIYVAVVHMGMEEEFQKSDSAKALAEACPELCAVMCGHAHETVECEYAGNAVLTEPGANGSNISQILITVEETEDGYEAKEVTSNLISLEDQPFDTDLDSILKPYHDRGVAHTESQIGVLKGGALVPESDMKGISQALFQDTALIDLINETMMYYASPYVPEGRRLVAASALVKKDSNIQEGPIRYCDIYNIYPYNNQLRLVEISGAQLKEYMEWSAEFYNQFNQGDVTISFNPERIYYNYDCFSGVNYQIDISKPAGDRIVNLTYSDGTLVNDSDIVYLATTDYRVNNHLNSELFVDNPCKIIYSSENSELESTQDMLVDYVSNVKNGVIYNSCDNNWSIIGADYDPAYHQMTMELIENGTISFPDKEVNTKSITESDVQQYVNDYPQYFL